LQHEERRFCGCDFVNTLEMGFDMRHDVMGYDEGMEEE
jgi:hypothetical protein